jgi:hypothetical protein
MSLAKKLNLKDGIAVRVIGRPSGVDLDDVAVSTAADAPDLLLFVKTLAEVDATCGPLVEAASRDRIAWAAYPKAKLLGTDLNRDILNAHLQKRGIQGVRMVSIDDTWSAMRFRPGR